MKLVLHPEALAEFEGEARRYESIQAGLVARFVDCVEAALGRVAESPDRWPLLDGEVRRCLVRIFPFAVLYALRPGRILVLTVMHCQRRPGYWRSRQPGGDSEPPPRG